MRISNQSAWIKSAVCSLSRSKNIPDYFGCDNESVITGQSGSLVAVTIKIDTGEKPEAIGWLVETARDGKKVESVSIGTYSTKSPNQLVNEVVLIDPETKYRFIFLDSSASSGMSYSVYGRGGEKLLSGKEFGRSIEQTLTLNRNDRNSRAIVLPWIEGKEYTPMSLKVGDEIVFSADRETDDIVQFASRYHYLNCLYQDAVRLPEVDGKATFKATRTGKVYIGCSKHCVAGHKVEIRIRKGLSKDFNKFKARPCDSNAGQGTKRLRTHSLKKCQNRCRRYSWCKGFQFSKGTRRISNCILYKGYPKASLIQVVRPDLAWHFSSYTCAAAT